MSVEFCLGSSRQLSAKKILVTMSSRDDKNQKDKRRHRSKSPDRGFDKWNERKRSRSNDRGNSKRGDRRRSRSRDRGLEKRSDRQVHIPFTVTKIRMHHYCLIATCVRCFAIFIFRYISIDCRIKKRTGDLDLAVDHGIERARVRAKEKKKRIEMELIEKKIGRELIVLWPLLSGI